MIKYLSSSNFYITLLLVSLTLSLYFINIWVGEIEQKIEYYENQ